MTESEQPSQQPSVPLSTLPADPARDLVREARKTYYASAGPRPALRGN